MKNLDQMNLDQLVAYSASLTKEKDEFLADYKSRQAVVHEMILSRQIADKLERDKDPEYKKLEQGIGVTVVPDLPVSTPRKRLKK